MREEFIPSDDLLQKRQSAETPAESEDISIKRYHTHKLPSGKEEVSDLLKIGVEGECCPHIVDVLGAQVIKGCKLQPYVYSAQKGVVYSYATCSPRGYINYWKNCPYKKELEGGAE